MSADRTFLLDGNLTNIRRSWLVPKTQTLVYAENSFGGGCHLEFMARGELRSLRGDDMIYRHSLSGGVFWERVCQFGSR